MTEENITNMEKTIQEEESKSLVEDALLNNNMEFEHDGKKHRVRKATFSEKQELYRIKLKKYVELLKDSTYITEKDLKKLLKDRGIDIEELDNKIKALDGQIKNLQLKLGELLVNKAPDSDLKVLRDEIKVLIDSQSILSIERNSYMEACLENQLLIYLYSYATYLMTEIFVDEKWKKVWNSYEEFEKGDESLILKSATIAAFISRDDVKV